MHVLVNARIFARSSVNLTPYMRIYTLCHNNDKNTLT